MDDITKITLLLGIIGTVTGVSSLLLEFYREILDGYKITLEIKKNMKGFNTEPFLKEKNEYIIFTVINRGKRPVKIRTIYLRLLTKREKENLILTDSFNCRHNRLLTFENPSTQYYLEQEGVNMKYLLYVGIIDDYGKHHKFYPRNKIIILFWYLYMRFRFNLF
jgi:hypothetical protein